MSDRDKEWMRRALAEGEAARAAGDVPVGAVVVAGGRIVGRGHNRREADHSPVAHAEVLALEEAAATLKRWRLSDCTLYVTLEPCFMCAGALVNARVERLVYAATDPKAGAVASLAQVCNDARLNHAVDVTAGVLEEVAAQQLRDFFRERRAAAKARRTRQKNGETKT